MEPLMNAQLQNCPKISLFCAGKGKNKVYTLQSASTEVKIKVPEVHEERGYLFHGTKSTKASTFSVIPDPWKSIDMVSRDEL